MSTLKTHNLQSPDAASVNIALAPNNGMVVAGISTFNNRVLIGTNIEGHADADDLTIGSSTNTAGITIRTNTSGTGRLWFSDGTSGAAEYQGYVQYDHNNQRLSLGSGGTTKLHITSEGNVIIAETMAVNRPRIVLSAPNDGTNYRHLFGANLQVNSSGTFTTPTANISGGGWEYLPANSLNDHGDLRYLSAPDTNSTSSTPLERLRINSSGTLEINQSGTNTNVLANDQGGPNIWLKNTSNTDGNYSKIGFFNSTGYITAFMAAQYQDAGDRNTDLVFGTRANGGNLLERLRIGSDGLLTATGNADFNVAGGEFDIYSTGSGDQLSLRLLNSDTTAGNKIGIYFGPCNNVAGAYIKGVAESDFTSAPNRDAGLELGTRLNATFLPSLNVSAAGYVTTPYQPAFKIAIMSQNSPNNGVVSENNGFTLKDGSSGDTFRDAFNNGNHFDQATGRFTAPVTGVYYFHFSVMRASSSGSGSMDLRIKKNTSLMLARSYRANYSTEGSFASMNVTTITSMTAGHFIEFILGANMSVYEDDSYMLGYLIG